MQASKCITVSLWGLTIRKESLLRDLYSTWRRMIQEKRGYGELRNAYPNVSALYARNASFHRYSSNDPIYLGTQDFRLIDAGKKFARWFVRIPIRRGVAVLAPLRLRKKDSDELASLKIHDSRLVEKDGRFDLHLSVSKEVDMNHAYSSVLSVDLGERYSAVAVLLSDACKASPRFYGKEVRGVRRHYAWLRKRLGERKLLKEIRRIKDTEKRIVDDYLHKASRRIVDQAKEHRAIIVLGDLQGIRKHNRGKKLNRIVANMPFHKLTQYITYKAAWEGIPVLTTSEAYTSKTCHNCNSEGKRMLQGLFRCSACGYECNADFNGAVNIGKRLLGYMLRSGVIGFSPIREASF